MEVNIIDERKKNRILERLKLKDHRNYGKDENGFNDQLVKFEEERKKVKFEKLIMSNLKANLRAQLRSPQNCRNTNTMGNCGDINCSLHTRPYMTDEDEDDKFKPKRQAFKKRK